MNVLRIMFLAGMMTGQQPQQPAMATASVEGIVVRAGTSEPVVGADVELTRMEGTPAAPIPPAIANQLRNALAGEGFSGATPPAAVASEVRYAKTGENGSFAFKDLKEGKYRLVAIKVGGAYYPAEYGQHDLKQRGLNFPVGEGQNVSNLKLEMTQTGAISGRVTDADGEPMGHVSVMALEPQMQQGQQILNIVQSGYTDERGEYRIFWLAPGRYYVAAKVVDLQMRTIPVDVIPPGRRGPYTRAESPVVTRQVLADGSVVEEAYALVYNGGARAPDQSQPVEVGPGATYAGADIPIGPGQIRSRHIRGAVVDESGQPAKGASVLAIPREWSPVALILRGSADSNGRFDLSGAVPGAYSLFATTSAAPAISPEMAAAAAAAGVSLPPPGSVTTGMGYLPIEIANADANNLRITAIKGVTIAGRVVIEGRPPADNDPAMGSIRIVLTRDPDIVGTPAPLMPLPPAPPPPPGTPPRLANGQPAGNGVVNLLVGLGDFKVSANGLPTNAYLKSVRMGGVDILAAGLRITGAAENPLEVVIGTDAGEITGTVLSTSSVAVPNAVVALVPEAPVLRVRPGVNRTATTDSDGKFRMPSVPPGTYRVFAWEFAEPGAWQDAAFVRKYESSGKTIVVRESSKQDTQLTVSPRR